MTGWPRSGPGFGRDEGRARAAPAGSAAGRPGRGWATGSSTCRWSSTRRDRAARRGPQPRRRATQAGDGRARDARRVSALLAVAVDRARLGSMVTERSEWFERIAHTDPLTGLANERTFARILELELARAGRQGGEVSLAIFDVDDLSATNDSAGRAVGDDILRAVAAVLAESVRLVDTVARVGGDEFVLVAPGAAGTAVAQRVLDGIAALPAAGGPDLGLGRRRPVPGRRWHGRRPARRGRGRAGHGEDRRTRRLARRAAPGPGGVGPILRAEGGGQWRLAGADAYAVPITLTAPSASRASAPHDR